MEARATAYLLHWTRPTEDNWNNIMDVARPSKAFGVKGINSFGLPYWHIYCYSRLGDTGSWLESIFLGSTVTPGLREDSEYVLEIAKASGNPYEEFHWPTRRVARTWELPAISFNKNLVVDMTWYVSETPLLPVWQDEDEEAFWHSTNFLTMDYGLLRRYSGEPTVHLWLTRFVTAEDLWTILTYNRLEFVELNSWIQGTVPAFNFRVVSDLTLQQWVSLNGDSLLAVRLAAQFRGIEE